MGAWPGLPPFLPFLSAPYAFPGGTPTGLNPNRPPVNPLHTYINVARHWNAEAMPVPVTIRLPIPPGMVNNPIVTGPNFTYTWQNFINDIQTTFNAWVNVQTANVGVSVSVTYNDPYAWDNVNFPNAAPGGNSNGTPPLTDPVVSGVLVWDNRPDAPNGQSHQGPTGNGTNDIIFLRRNHVGGTGGVTSMLVDPVTGQISEADCIFDLDSFVGLANNNVTGLNPTGQQPWNPRQTTAYRHEIGHFFGLDHTNLHQGLTAIPVAASGQPPLPNPAPTGGMPQSLNSRFTPATPGTNTATGIVISEYPAMAAAVVTHTSQNHVQAPLHDDDGALISVLYPVPSMNAGIDAAKVPLINTHAMVLGALSDTDLPPGVEPPAGDYGSNVLLYLSNTQASNQLQPGLPIVGVVTGLHRVDNADIVGSQDTTTGAPSSGVFVVEGIPINPSPALCPGCTTINVNTINSNGRLYDIVIEPLESSGIGVGTGTISEWMREPWMNPAPANTWTPLSRQTAFISDQLVPSSNQNPVATIELAAGTVLVMGATSHNAVQAAYRVMRPLVQIVPRGGRPGPTGTITIQADGNVGINTNTATLTINNVPQALPPPSSGGNGSVTVQWTLSGSILPSGPARLQFSVSEQSAPQGYTLAPGINVVQY